MAILVNEGDTFEATYESGVSGQAGTVAVEIDDGQSNTVFGPTVVGIHELGTTGTYSRTMTAPGVAGTQWVVLWSLDGTFDPKTVSVEDLYVLSASGIDPVPPLVPIESDGNTGGPCRAWTTVEKVAECCSTESDTSVLEESLVAASQVLWALSGQRFPGACEQRVRPCGRSNCEGPWGAWAGAGWASYGLGVYGNWGSEDGGCGCSPLSRVPLAGHAREILEVTIDGLILDASEYRLDDHRWLTRLRDSDDDRQFWPSCQDLDRAEDEDGTFSVLYTFGMDPPVAGQLAAAELACAIHQTCAGGAGGGSADLGDCPLPNNVVKIERQGITIEMEPFAAFGRKDSVWKTGLPLTDMFLNAYNPTGRRRRRATVWSPDTRRFPRAVGGSSS